MTKTPNQNIDEITNRVYPPASAVIPQLMTIRQIIPPTIEMYTQTEDLHTIMPNLDMISRAIKYLRGAPFIEIPDPNKPEETPHPLDPQIQLAGGNDEYYVNAQWDEDSVSKIVTVNIIGYDLKTTNEYPDLFDSIPKSSITASILVPVEIGKTYHIMQVNPALEFYSSDPDIRQREDGAWIKQKDYHNDSEEFEYAFVIPSGSNIINILVYCLEDEVIVADYHIATELSFIEEPELEPEPTPEPDPDESESGEEGDNSDDGQTSET